MGCGCDNNLPLSPSFKFKTSLIATHCDEFCTIVIRAGKQGQVLENLNMNEVPFVVIGSLFLAKM